MTDFGDSIDLIDEVLSTARSVRRKLDFDRPVERQVLLDAINVAVQAPTGIGGESWRFVVVDEARRKARIAELYSETLLGLLADRGMPLKATHRALIERMPDIPALVFVCYTAPPIAQGWSPDTVGSQVGYYGSILPAAWSLMLALRARGIGTTWTSLLSARQAEVAEVIAMPDECVQMVMLPVAYTKDAVLKRAERLPAEAVTYWNAWGDQG